MVKIVQKVDIAYVAEAIVFYREGNHSVSFHLLQKTPIGYMDYINIYLKIIEELNESIENYCQELNISIRKQMYICINDGIWQSKSMIPFSPLILIGFAFNLWTIFKPDTIINHINKFLDFLYLFIVIILISFPIGRFLRNFLHIKRRLFK